jgi:hypothetical protein
MGAFLADRASMPFHDEEKKMIQFFTPFLVLLLSTALLYGCGSRDVNRDDNSNVKIRGVRDITLADGSPAKLVECVSPGVCYLNAGKACPSGYEVLDSDVVSDRKNIPFAKEVRSSWIVRCK